MPTFKMYQTSDFVEELAIRLGEAYLEEARREGEFGSLRFVHLKEDYNACVGGFRQTAVYKDDMGTTLNLPIIFDLFDGHVYLSNGHNRVGPRFEMKFEQIKE